MIARNRTAAGCLPPRAPAQPANGEVLAAKAPAAAR
jgi:hypothetical protein